AELVPTPGQGATVGADGSDGAGGTGSAGHGGGAGGTGSAGDGGGAGGTDSAGSAGGVIVRDPADEGLLAQLELRPRAVRDLDIGEGRAQLVRRLRALATAGVVTLDWTLTGAGAGPRFERWVRLADGAGSRA